MRSTKLPLWIERLVGLDDPRGPVSVFMLDERELVLAHFLRQDGSVPELQAVRRRELPADTFQEGPLGGPLREPAQFHEIVAELQQAADTAIGEPIARAALVVPDRWLRLTFAELEEVPGKPHLREETLRFKLRKQVPFRVEELRVRGRRTGAAGNGAKRFLIGFGVEHVLTQIEDSFRSAGIHIGAVTNESLGAADGIARLQGDSGAFLLLIAHRDGYSLLAHGDGGPALFRYKSIDPELEPSVASNLAVRDLRLTRSFIEERELFGAERTLPGCALMLAAEEARGVWRDRLEEGLGLPARILDGNGTFGAGPGTPDIGVQQALPMLGASLTVRA